jgi:hypothetical protein
MLNVLPIEGEGFSIITLGEMNPPTMKFSGNGDSAAVEPLDDYLNQLHAALLQKRSRSVAIDFTQLYFMNSSCLKAFATWIHEVNTTGRPYSVTLQMNPGLNWQKRTLRALGRLAPAVVSISEVTL